MIVEPVLVDSGALIAIYNVNDPHHAACVEQLKTLPVGKAYTCWPVVTESAYLLRRHPAQRTKLLQAVAADEFALLPLGGKDLEGIQQVFEKYHDHEVDLADAALVHLAHREGIETVFTLDRRHFSVFRLNDRRPLRLLPDHLSR